MLKIKHYSILKDFSAVIDGEIVYTHPSNEDFSDFLTSLYREHSIKYPKFFKMDNISKAGFLATELCLLNTKLSDTEEIHNTAIFLLSSSSSLDTDKKYQDTLKDEEYFPSPKVFVYTLPNIVLGEIAIRHKIYGENTCFICEHFADEAVFKYIYQCFVDTDIKNAIVLWADYINESGEAIAVAIEKENENNYNAKEFSIESIKFLIK